MSYIFMHVGMFLLHQWHRYITEYELFLHHCSLYGSVLIASLLCTGQFLLSILFIFILMDLENKCAAASGYCG